MRKDGGTGCLANQSKYNVCRKVSQRLRSLVNMFRGCVFIDSSRTKDKKLQ